MVLLLLAVGEADISEGETIREREMDKGENSQGTVNHGARMLKHVLKIGIGLLIYCWCEKIILF